MITIALSKGHQSLKSVPLLQAAGITPLWSAEPARKLILSAESDTSYYRACFRCADLCAIRALLISGIALTTWRHRLVSAAGI